MYKLTKLWLLSMFRLTLKNDLTFKLKELEYRYEKRRCILSWNNKEIAWLRKNINKYSRKELAEKLHKTESQIRGACHYFEIKKTTAGKKVRRLKTPMTKQEYQKRAYQKRKNESKKDNS